MRAKSTAAVLFLALTGPLAADVPTAEAAPAVIAVVPHLARSAGHPKAPYVDLEGQVIHDGARTVAISPPLAKPLAEVWATAAGYLARDRSLALYRVSPDGVATLMVAKLQSGDPGSVEVENGGQRVAVDVIEQSADPTTPNPTYADVFRTSDGVRLNRLPLEVDGLFGFRNGVVTLGAPLKEKLDGQRVIGSQIATWDVSGQAVALGGKRLRNPQFADVDFGVMGRTAHLGRGPLSVLPLVKGTGTPWTAPGEYIAAISPDGRLAVTFAYSYQPGSLSTMTIRNARNGVAKRSFRVDARDVSGWETNRSYLVKVFDPTRKKSALMRLSLNGKVQRVSGFAKTPDRLLTVS